MGAYIVCHSHTCYKNTEPLGTRTHFRRNFEPKYNRAMQVFHEGQISRRRLNSSNIVQVVADTLGWKFARLQCLIKMVRAFNKSECYYCTGFVTDEFREVYRNTLTILLDLRRKGVNARLSLGYYEKPMCLKYRSFYCFYYTCWMCARMLLVLVIFL